MTITPEEVAKLAAAATPRPWFNTVQSGEITDAKGYYIGRAMLAGTSVGRANAAFLAAAHDMAALIAEQDEALKAADELIAVFADYAEDMAKGLLVLIETKKDIWREDLARVAAYRAARETLK